MKTVLLFLLLLTGCAYPSWSTHYEPTTPLPEKALIYIYRTQTTIDSVNPEIPKFFINGHELGKLVIGGYYVQSVDPGEIEVYYKNSFMGFYPWKSGTIQLKAQAGQKYFIKFSIESLMRIVSFKIVPAEIGAEEIKSTSLLVN